MKALLPNVAAFGQRARKIREETGIPLLRLCDDAHLPPSWVSHLETRQQKPDVYSLQDWEGARSGIRRETEGQ
jgi:transcriptional regulator with XRE-family HTH domain